MIFFSKEKQNKHERVLGVDDKGAEAFVSVFLDERLGKMWSPEGYQD